MRIADNVCDTAQICFQAALSCKQRQPENKPTMERRRLADILSW
nr:hypothetical protein [uncultured Kingella sp.]